MKFCAKVFDEAKVSKFFSLWGSNSDKAPFRIPKKSTELKKYIRKEHFINFLDILRDGKE